MGRINGMKREVIKRVQSIDLEILEGLYEYRILSTDQIQRRHGMTKRYTYRKIELLRNSGLISSHPIVRYRMGQRSQGKYHRITSKGLSVLKDNGHFIDKTVQQLEVRQVRTPYLLATNDIMVDLEPYGWVLTDSREIKSRIRANRKDIVQGTLQNVYTSGKEYAIYTFLHSTSDKNVAKMTREVRNYTQSNENGGMLRDFIIFTKGKECFERVASGILYEEDKVLLPRVGSIKVFPFTFGKYYLRTFEDEKEIRSYVSGVFEDEIVFKKLLDFTEVNAKYSGLNCIVEHNGEEKYFVNLVDNDLKKVFNIQQYRKEDYELDGRKRQISHTF